MRCVIRSRLRAECSRELLEAAVAATLGSGSVARDEYLCNMRAARQMEDGSVRWAEACHSPTTLPEERASWERYFQLKRVQDAHVRCRDASGEELWACSSCDWTDKLEASLAGRGELFLANMRAAAP